MDYFDINVAHLGATLEMTVRNGTKGSIQLTQLVWDRDLLLLSLISDILHGSVAQAITKHEINDSLIAHQQKYQ